MISLYQMYRKQDKVIGNIENGAYTYSQRGIKIPEGERPTRITREEFPQMFQVLEKAGVPLDGQASPRSTLPPSRHVDFRPATKGSIRGSFA